MIKLKKTFYFLLLCVSTNIFSANPKTPNPRILAGLEQLWNKNEVFVTRARIAQLPPPDTNEKLGDLGEFPPTTVPVILLSKEEFNYLQRNPYHKTSGSYEHEFGHPIGRLRLTAESTGEEVAQQLAGITRIPPEKLETTVRNSADIHLLGRPMQNLVVRQCYRGNPASSRFLYEHLIKN